MSRQIITPEGDKKFDARVTIRNQKGQVVKHQPYTLVISGGMQVFIDKKTGKRYYANGDEIPEPKAPAVAPAMAPVLPVTAKPVEPKQDAPKAAEEVAAEPVQAAAEAEEKPAASARPAGKNAQAAKAQV